MDTFFGLNATNVDDNLQTYEKQNSPLLDLDFDYIVNGIIIPTIAVFGVVGNIFNLFILSWRYHKREVDVLEKGALLGLIALAISDMLFCLVIFPHVFYYKQKTYFKQASFRMYYEVYGSYFQNVFIKTSTFLTLVVGVARYIGICHPLRARLFIGLNAMRAACVITYIIWFALMLPLLFKFSINEFSLTNTSTSYIIDHGSFILNANLNRSFTYLWSLLGYFIPLAILAFCNVNLIRALHQSIRLRETSARSHTANRDLTSRITLTLIVLIVMFMLLVSPSEILHFILEIFGENDYRNIEIALMVTNVLQAINFAFHFVLYCVVNATFRRIVLSFIYMLTKPFKKKQQSPQSESKFNHDSLNSNDRTTRLNYKGRTVFTRVTDSETYV